MDKFLSRLFGVLMVFGLFAVQFVPSGALAVPCRTCGKGNGSSGYGPRPAAAPAPKPAHAVIEQALAQGGVENLPPLVLSQQDYPNASPGTRDRSMYTEVTLTRWGPRVGEVEVATYTRTDRKTVGFTGGVRVDLMASDGTVLASILKWPLGVDGVWVGQHKRWDRWSAKVDPSVAAATTRLRIVQEHMGKNRFMDVAKTLKEWAEVIGTVITILA